MQRNLENQRKVALDNGEFGEDEEQKWSYGMEGGQRR